MRKEPLLKITVFPISVPVFKLNACFRREFELQEGVADGVLLVSVDSPSVCLKVKAAKAEGGLIVDSRKDTFSRIRAILTGKAGRLEPNPISGKKGIELVEGETRRSCGADEEQIALGEARLNGRDVNGLKQLRLKQFADSGDLVARQNRVGSASNRWAEKFVGSVLTDFPSFDQAKLLETQIVVDLAKGCAARSQVRIEQLVVTGRPTGCCSVRWLFACLATPQPAGSWSALRIAS